jgi:hypothetical protein
MIAVPAIVPCHKLGSTAGGPGPSPWGSSMADESLIEKVHDLSDLELGILLSLISREHCLISTPRDALDDLVEELQLVRRSPLPLDIA